MSAWRRLGWLLALLIAAGCAGTARAPLHDELGGAEGIEALAGAIIAEVHADPRISDLFAETDDDYFRARLVEQLCELADGPCTYTGLPMTDAHSGMDISEREFNWFVEGVERAMAKTGLPLATQNRLLARLARMRDDVIRQ